MGAFLSYTIVSGVLLLAMFAAYRVLMAGDNRHAYNRGVLLSIYMIAFLSMPLYNLPGNLFAATPAAAPAFHLADVAVTVDVAPAANPWWGRALLWIFISGMAVTLLRTVAVWTRIIRIIARGEKTDKGRYTLVLTDNAGIAPFSWMRYMVMNRADYAGDSDAIVVHELRHITCRHWIDLLVAQAVTIINWYNPAAWLMRSQLMLVHEYQADAAVINNSFNPKEYQMLLIKKAVGSKFPSLANSLNHSKLKKRITMMYKSKSCAGSRLKVLALAPAVIAAVLVTSVPQVKAAISTIRSSEVFNGKVNNLSANGETNADEFRLKSINNHDNKTTVVIAGTIPGRSLEVESATLINGDKIYFANGMDCQMTDGNATITVTFPFMTEFDDNCSVTLGVNGSNVKIDLLNVQTYPASAVTEVRTTEKADLHAEYYIDGKKITTADFEKIEPGDIAEIKIDKQGEIPSIYITLKK